MKTIDLLYPHCHLSLSYPTFLYYPGNISDGGNEVVEDYDDDYDNESDAEDSNNKKYQGVPSTGKYGNFLARQFWKGGDEKPSDRGQEDPPHHATRDESETNTIGRRVSTVAFTVAGATSNVVGGAADLVVGVAALTPGLQTLVRPQVHRYVCYQDYSAII